jgi:hypothetical protein
LREKYTLVDLARLEALATVAERPTRQFALSLPCSYVTFGSPLPHIRPMIDYQNLIRWPAAIIKLYVSFEMCDSDITCETLFPKDERLYRELLAAKAPYLAVYG